MKSDTVSSPPSAAALLAHLELPAPSQLTAPQVRGAHCVWCDMRLEGATALDLGQRREEIGGVVSRWFPRGCRRCAEREALKALVEHGQTCEQCVDDRTRCPTGLSLVRAVRAARR